MTRPAHLTDPPRSTPELLRYAAELIRIHGHRPGGSYWPRLPSRLTIAEALDYAAGRVDGPTRPGRRFRGEVGWRDRSSNACRFVIPVICDRTGGPWPGLLPWNETATEADVLAVLDRAADDADRILSRSTRRA